MNPVVVFKRGKFNKFVLDMFYTLSVHLVLRLPDYTAKRELAEYKSIIYACDNFNIMKFGTLSKTISQEPGRAWGH